MQSRRAWRNFLTAAGFVTDVEAEVSRVVLPTLTVPAPLISPAIGPAVQGFYFMFNAAVGGAVGEYATVKIRSIAGGVWLDWLHSIQTAPLALDIRDGITEAFLSLTGDAALISGMRCYGYGPALTALSSVVVTKTFASWSVSPYDGFVRTGTATAAPGGPQFQFQTNTALASTMPIFIPPGLELCLMHPTAGQALSSVNVVGRVCAGAT